MSKMKEIRWIGSSFDCLLSCPSAIRRAAGFQLRKIQAGALPDDWKPFDQVGGGTRELRLRDTGVEYCVLYISGLPEAVYVLHCFAKKSNKTAQPDKNIAARRYRAVLQLRRSDP